MLSYYKLIIIKIYYKKEKKTSMLFYKFYNYSLYYIKKCAL